MPARAAYAASAVPWFPVVDATAFRKPSTRAMVSDTAWSRSLNDPVGFRVSSFSQMRGPSVPASRTSGVAPSARLRTDASIGTGRSSRNRHSPPGRVAHARRVPCAASAA